jgi:hypothetical protein
MRHHRSVDISVWCAVRRDPGPEAIVEVEPFFPHPSPVLFTGFHEGSRYGGSDPKKRTADQILILAGVLIAADSFDELTGFLIARNRLDVVPPLPALGQCEVISNGPVWLIASPDRLIADRGDLGKGWTLS